MDKVTFETKTSPVTSEEIEFAYIDRGNGEFTSMTKAHYEEQLEAAKNVAN